jgi:two-component system sensor histidine kinase DegS
VEATVYRLVQEATNNAIKHADPSKISITVGRGDAMVEVVVADDGRGFDSETAERGFGLLGMEERVSLAGGRLEIESAPGRGTEVHAEVPHTKERPTGRLAPPAAESTSSFSESSRPPS